MKKSKETGDVLGDTRKRNRTRGRRSDNPDLINDQSDFRNRYRALLGKSKV